MAQTTFSVRMDSEIKQRFEKFCAEEGLTTARAINLFARAVVREQRLPFEVVPFAKKPDPFYSEANQEFLRESIAALDAGKGIVRKTIEELEAMENG
ncbi:MAG: type II toxin-antitoxin system RelB/DinJ family antitoxin [Clostridiales bacterium]|jgi:DNA-damage-inducible protein J|nr:type II toxin-antitoxin system RelB/DinJ family antitoxin [Clostridiales bacterium]